jgi:predicted TIM-barrel fold metal-dependent hydrolase
VPAAITPADVSPVQRALRKWWRISLNLFGPPITKNTDLYIRLGLKFRTNEERRQVFRRALDVVGPKRLLFGTDSSFFPRGWHHQVFDDQAKAVYELNASLTDARSIFGENLLRILAR